MKLTLSSLTVLLLFVGFIFSGCKEDSSTLNNGKLSWEDKDQSCDLSNESNYYTLVEAGETRGFLMHLPAGYNGVDKLPLIINFHGFGGCASYFQSEVGDLNQIADANQFIVVYPQAVEGPKGDVYWEPADNGSNNISQSDVYFTQKLIAYLDDNYAVDVNKVYAVGYSNGGMMAYGLACAKPNLIAAAGIMSGVMLPQDCNTNEQTSIIHFHGIEDGVLPYGGNNDYQGVQDVMDFWAAHNGLNFNMEVTFNNTNGTHVSHTIYGDSSDATSVQLYTIHELAGQAGGHVWFTEEIGGKRSNLILWDFLSQYSLDD